MKNKRKISTIFDMNNKTVAIFGGAGKIGTNFAQVLSLAGANVIILDLKKKKLTRKIKKFHLSSVMLDQKFKLRMQLMILLKTSKKLMF